MPVSVRSDLDDRFEDSPQQDGGSFVDQLDLQHSLRVLRKHKWSIFTFCTVVTALAAYYAFTATPIYRATSVLLIEEQRPNVISVKELYGADSEDADYYQTQFELLQSRSLAAKVIEALGLWNHPELAGGSSAELAEGGAETGSASAEGGWFDAFRRKLDSLSDADPAMDGEPGADRPAASPDGEAGPYHMSEEDRRRERVISAFMGRLSIAPVRKTKLVEVSYESADPALAAEIADTVNEQYIVSYLDAKMEMTQKASVWLNERLASLKRTLKVSEERLVAFKEDNNLVDVGGSVGRLNEQELLLVTAELAEARSDLADAADLYREVRALSGSPELLETVPGVQADPLVRQTKLEQGGAQRELDELRNRYGERHPTVVDAQSQLDTLNRTLQGHVRRVVGSIEKNYQLLQQRVATIERKLASGKQEIQALGSKTFELSNLEREVATNREIYDTFFNSMSEARSADGLETANARIADYAIPPTNPVRPKKQLIVALAALGSLLLSILMALLYEQMDDTIKSTYDVEDKLGIRLLGLVPLIKGGLLRRGDSLPLDPETIAERNDRFAESVNTIRTGLWLDRSKESNRVIMVTSSVPGEGKSTVSINLAHSLSQFERVLLVDCDMRRPTIAKAAGLERSALGLSNLLSGSATGRQCIVRGTFGGSVDIMPSGPLPEQPLELLSSKRFERVIEQLGRHYDRIVLDSAPTQAVSDALVLSRLSDMIIYCIKSHDTSIELIKWGVKRLRQVGASVTGAVVTQVDMEKISAYGGDHYYQGYYDYYGYSEKGGASGGKMRLSQEELIRIRRDEGEVELDLFDEPVRRRERAAPEVAERPVRTRGGRSPATASHGARFEEFEAEPVGRRGRASDSDLDIV